jgi:predicted metal-dependent HD superfamily phosphohydrolase
MKDRLKGEFVELWLGVAADGPANAGRICQSLLAHYAEPGRHYHTIDHVNHCLDQARLVTDLLPDSSALNLAIWFHDCVYDPMARDNEARSAALFREFAAPVMSPPMVDDVERLVLVTQAGQAPRQADEGYMVDIDLSSFGLPWEPFLADSLAVRAERPHLTDGQYAVQQARFLNSLLERESIFATDFFRARYEDVARSNIGRYLDVIAHRVSQGPP